MKPIFDEACEALAYREAKSKQLQEQRQLQLWLKGASGLVVRAVLQVLRLRRLRSG